MDNKIVVVWNDVSPGYINSLKKKFFSSGPIKEYFGDHEEPDFTLYSSMEHVLDDQLNLKSDFLESAKNAGGLFILAEIDWIDTLKSSFIGFDIIKQIRSEILLFPIFLFSEYSKQYFYDEDEPKFNILKTPAHYHVNLAGLDIDLKDSGRIIKLTENLRLDIMQYVYDPTGVIEEIIHTTKNKLPYETRIFSQKEFEDLKNKFILLKERIIKLFSEEETGKIEDAFKSILSKIEKDHISEKKLSVIKYLSELKFSIKGLFGIDEDDELTDYSERPWKVLMIDDDQHICEKLGEKFENRGISLISANSGVEALQILNDDFRGNPSKDNKPTTLPNTITAVVIDWRFQNEIEEWDDLQGYDILSGIYNECKSIVSMFILTSKKGAILRKMQRQNELNTSWFAKEDILASETSFEMFLDRIVEGADASYDSLMMRPSLPKWTSKPCYRSAAPLGHYYRAFRMSGNYLQLEKEISDAATDYFTQAVQLYRNSDDAKIEFDLAPTAGMNSTDFKQVWKLFRDRMIARRVALALYKLEKWEVEMIRSILSTRSLTVSDSVNRYLFTDAICLSVDFEKNFGDKLLVEEVNWLESSFGYQAGLINEKIRIKLKSLFTHFSRTLQEKLSGDDKKLDEYSSRFPVFFDQIEFSEIDQLKNLLEQSFEILKSSMSFRDLEFQYSIKLKKLLKENMILEFFEKFQLLDIVERNVKKY